MQSLLPAYLLLKKLVDTEGIHLEPSALAGMMGPMMLGKDGTDYLLKHHLTDKMKIGTHIIWGTGGSMVPADIMKQYYQKGMNF